MRECIARAGSARPARPARDYFVSSWVTIAAGLGFICPWVHSWDAMPGMDEWDQIGLQALMGLILTTTGMWLRVTARPWAAGLAALAWAAVGAGYALTDPTAIELMIAVTMALMLAGTAFEARS